MSKTDNVKWLLVGTGDIAGKRVASALSETAPGKLVAVCDLIKDRAQACAEKFNVDEIYTDLDEALKKTSANAVYLATPVFLHAAQAAKVLQAGKHVLVEKPLGLTAGDCAQAIAAARETGLRAGCAYYRRFYPCFDQARQMIQAGEFGQIVLVRMTYFSWFNPTQDDPKYWRVVKAKSGGGPLSDMGTHMFDVLIGLLGMPGKVYAKTRTLTHDYEVEDTATMLMEMPDGAEVVASFNWNSKTWAHEFEIIGTEAKVKWFPYDAGKIVKTVGRDIKELDMPNAENVHAPVVADFVDAVVNDRDPAVTLEEAQKTNMLLDAVYQSSDTQREAQL